MELTAIDEMIMARLTPERWIKVAESRHLPPVWWAEVSGKENHRWEPRAHGHHAVCQDQAELSMAWGVDFAEHNSDGQPEWVEQMTFRKHAGETCVDFSWNGMLVLRVGLWKYDGAYLPNPQMVDIPEDPEKSITWEISADQLSLAKLITTLSGPTDFEPGRWFSNLPAQQRTGLRWPK